MPQWVANILRTLGIIATIGTTLIASLGLLLASMCAGSSQGPSGSGVPYFLGAIAVVVVGIWIITLLGRGIANSAEAALATPRYTVVAAGHSERESALHRQESSRTSPSEPLPLTPANQKAIDHLVWAMGAQIVVSILCWFLSQQYYWTAPSNLAPHNWMLLLAVPFFLYRVPYLILIFRFLTRPANRTLTYALVVPAILAFQAIFDLGLVNYFYVHHPVGFLLLLLPWSIHILIVVLAWKAIRQIGLQPGGSSLFRAAVITFIYFACLHVASPLVYLYVRR